MSASIKEFMERKKNFFFLDKHACNYLNLIFINYRIYVVLTMSGLSLVTIALATTISILVGCTAAVEITTNTPIIAKNVTTENAKGLILYNVTVNDTNGSALKEVIVQIDQTPVDAINSKQKPSSSPGKLTIGNVTSGFTTPVAPNISVSIKTTTKATNLAAVETSPKINVTITSTTTELISTKSQPKITSAEVVRFVPNKYCYCDLTVSIIHCC